MVFPPPPVTTGIFGTTARHLLGGTQGVFISPSYLGIGAFAVALGGLVAWRRDRKLWFFGLIAGATSVLALGAHRGMVLPWQLVDRVPLLEDVVASRFVLFTVGAVAVTVAIVVDHCHSWVGEQRHSPRWLAAAASLAVAAAALVPMATYLTAIVPVTVVPVVVPAWFQTVSPRLASDQVVLVLPAPFTLIQSPMTWQALDGLQYPMVGQGGPGGIPARAGAEAPGQAVLEAATSVVGASTTITRSDVLSVRAALRGWRTTTVVVPDQPALPPYERIPSVSFAAALLTAATGAQPVLEAHAWVWKDVRRAGATALPSTLALTSCTTGRDPYAYHAVEDTATCVLAAFARSAP